MTKAFQLTLVRATSNISFDVTGTPEPMGFYPTYKEASTDPRPPETIRERWRFTGCRFTASTIAALIASGTSLRTFVTALKTRGSGQVTSAILVRDPSSANVTELTLSEEFQIESVESDRDNRQPSEDWITQVRFNIVMTGRTRKVDSNGIVRFSQSVRMTEEDGLLVTEWLTDLETAEGTSAVTKLATYGRIPDTAVTTRHTWETNNSTGVHVTYTDADETTLSAPRTPTRARGVSRIRQWGTNIGATAPGGSPSRVDYRVTTTTKGTLTTVTTEAAAFGPNAESWVLQRRPSFFKSEILSDRSAQNGYSAVWSTEETAGGGGSPQGQAAIDQWLISAELSGGGEIVDMEPVAYEGAEPVVFFGAIMPWELKLTVSIRHRGIQPARNEMQLPAKLPLPWILMRNESKEFEPSRIDVGASPSQDLWERRAQLVYRAATTPDGSINKFLLESPPVDSYYLSESGSEPSGYGLGFLFG